MVELVREVPQDAERIFHPLQRRREGQSGIAAQAMLLHAIFISPCLTLSSDFSSSEDLM